jgi:hypothetical protein
MYIHTYICYTARRGGASMGRLILLFALSVLLLTSVGLARTWYITDDGTGDAPTIQAGLDSAAAGDTVLAACGTYYEHDIVMKSGVCLCSETGDPACATIDAQQQGRVIYCNDVNWNTTIEGFTLTGGSAVGGGGGGGAIWCGGASYPHFINLLITDNEVSLNDEISGYGGGLCLWGASARLTHVVFTGNVARWGGGMHFLSDYQGKAAWFTDVTFSENSAQTGGGFHTWGGDSLSMADVDFVQNNATGSGGAMACLEIAAYWRMTGCSFMQNSADIGGGIETSDSRGLIEDCTFAGNSARIGGAFCNFHGWSPGLQGCTMSGNSAEFGSCVYIADGSLDIANCILAYGTGGQAIDYYNATVTCTCCDIYGNEGGDWAGPVAGQDGMDGNFSSCPAFCDTSAGDFQLCDESPCLPGNHPYVYDCGLIGAWGQGCVCGPSAIEPMSWGAIKAMHR